MSFGGVGVMTTMARRSPPFSSAEGAGRIDGLDATTAMAPYPNRHDHQLAEADDMWALGLEGDGAVTNGDETSVLGAGSSESLRAATAVLSTNVGNSQVRGYSSSSSSLDLEHTDGAVRSSPWSLAAAPTTSTSLPRPATHQVIAIMDELDGIPAWDLSDQPSTVMTATLVRPAGVTSVEEVVHGPCSSVIVLFWPSAGGNGSGKGGGKL